MTLHLELSEEEVQLVTSHLSRHLRQLDAELVRTDKPDLQHALALETDQLRALLARLTIAPSTVHRVPEPWHEQASDENSDPDFRVDFEGV